MAPTRSDGRILAFLPILNRMLTIFSLSLPTILPRPNFDGMSFLKSRPLSRKPPSSDFGFLSRSLEMRSSKGSSEGGTGPISRAIMPARICRTSNPSASSCSTADIQLKSASCLRNSSRKSACFFSAIDCSEGTRILSMALPVKRSMVLS